MANAKSPLELISPFNQWSVSQEKGRNTPSAFFGGSKRLVNLSPNDYYKLVASQTNTTPEKLIASRTKNTNEISTDDIQKKMREGVKFDTPWIRLNDAGEKGSTDVYFQEGLHRMLAAGREYGMDTKFPIYLAYENDPWNDIDKIPIDDFIKHYDDTRLKRYNMRQEREREHQRQIDEFNKEMAADLFKVGLDQVTPEMIKQYLKYEDELFRDDYFDEEL